MHLTYWRDDSRRRVEFVSAGRFDAETIIAAIQRQHREGVRAYALLSDARSVTGAPTFEELGRIQAAEAECGEAPGPLVIIAADDAVFRKACAYAVLAATHRPINVVADRADAEDWLREQGF